MSKQPRRLAPGSHIRVVAPAGRVDRDRLNLGIETLRQRGFTVSLGHHVWDRAGYLAGSDADRAADLEEALVDETVDAVILARGGWGSLRTLTCLHRERIADAPAKIVLGYSDITALHAYLSQLDWVSFHGPLAESDWRDQNGERALHVLSGGTGYLGDDPLEHLVDCGGWPEGAPATLIGGNLSVLTALLATPFLPPLERGRVLYLEEVQEAPYRIDRMMTQLRLAGVLSRVRAVVFGEATRCAADPDVEGYTARDVVLTQCAAAGVDLYWGLAAGHGPTKWTLPLGWPVVLDGGRVRLRQPAVR